MKLKIEKIGSIFPSINSNSIKERIIKQAKFFFAFTHNRFGKLCVSLGKARATTKTEPRENIIYYGHDEP